MVGGNTSVQERDRNDGNQSASVVLTQTESIEGTLTSDRYQSSRHIVRLNEKEQLQEQVATQKKQKLSEMSLNVQ